MSFVRIPFSLLSPTPTPALLERKVTLSSLSLLHARTYLPGRVYKTEKEDFHRSLFPRFRSVYIAAAVVLMYCLHSLDTPLATWRGIRPIRARLFSSSAPSENKSNASNNHRHNSKEEEEKEKSNNFSVHLL